MLPAALQGRLCGWRRAGIEQPDLDVEEEAEEEAEQAQRCQDLAKQVVHPCRVEQAQPVQEFLMRPGFTPRIQLWRPFSQGICSINK